MKGLFRFGILTIILISITFANDQFVRSHWLPEYNNELRLLDHFLAALIIPWLPYQFKKDSFYWFCLWYLVLCIYWETRQCFQRGYFQYGQLTADMIGLGFSIILFRILVKKVRISR